MVPGRAVNAERVAEVDADFHGRGLIGDRRWRRLVFEFFFGGVS